MSNEITQLQVKQMENSCKISFFKKDGWLLKSQDADVSVLKKLNATIFLPHTKEAATKLTNSLGGLFDALLNYNTYKGS